MDCLVRNTPEQESITANKETKAVTRKTIETETSALQKLTAKIHLIIPVVFVF